jgi:hypothetical protein
MKHITTLVVAAAFLAAPLAATAGGYKAAPCAVPAPCAPVCAPAPCQTACFNPLAPVVGVVQGVGGLVVGVANGIAGIFTCSPCN